MVDPSDERRFLDRVAEVYDSRTDFDRYLLEFGADLILEEFQGRRMLEVGCASGVMTRRFAARVPELHVVDGSAKYISDLRGELGDRVDFHLSLAEEFEPETPFDAVVIASLLEHVEAPVDLLRRASRWLERDGSLFVIVPNANSLHRQVGVAMGLLKTIHSFSERDIMLGHRRVYDEALLRSQIREAGLQIRSWHGILIKVLPNAQMQSLPEPVIRALLTVGMHQPHIAADIYARCTPA